MFELFFRADFLEQPLFELMEIEVDSLKHLMVLKQELFESIIICYK